MPLYTYRCKDCKDEVDVVQSMEEGDRYLKARPKCKKCDGEVQRIIKGANFKLEGRGWERDGYS